MKMILSWLLGARGRGSAHTSGVEAVASHSGAADAQLPCELRAAVHAPRAVLPEVPAHDIHVSLKAMHAAEQDMTCSEDTNGCVAHVIVDMMTRLLEGQVPEADRVSQVLSAVQEGRNIYTPAPGTSQPPGEPEELLPLYTEARAAGVSRSCDWMHGAASYQSGMSGFHRDVSSSTNLDQGAGSDPEGGSTAENRSRRLLERSLLAILQPPGRPCDVSDIKRRASGGDGGHRSASPQMGGLRTQLAGRSDHFRCSMHSTPRATSAQDDELSMSLSFDPAPHLSDPTNACHQTLSKSLLDHLPCPPAASASAYVVGEGSVHGAHHARRHPAWYQTQDSRCSCASGQSVHSTASSSQATRRSRTLDLSLSLRAYLACPLSARCSWHGTLSKSINLDEVLAFAESSLDAWDWDSLHFQQITGDRALSVLAYFYFHKYGLIEQFSLDPNKLIRFLCRVEEGYYKPNPYHNSTHAASVLHSMAVLLHKGGLVPTYVEPCSITLMACLLAAIVHDYGHLGVSNDFLIGNSDPLALTYNDKLPLENVAIASSFALLSHPEYSFLEDLSDADFNSLRKLVIDLVLATDMGSSHCSVMSQFNSCFEVGPMPATLFSQKEEELQELLAGAQREPKPCASSTQRTMALQLAIKCADLGHTASSWANHVVWVDRLQEEFHLQGDLERTHQLPPSPMCDRSTSFVKDGQMGFLDGVVVPMMWACYCTFPGSAPQLAQTLSNRHRWAARLSPQTGQQPEAPAAGTSSLP